MKSAFLVAVVFFALTAGAEVIKSEYRGMASLTMRNLSLEVIITPGINRIMSLRRLHSGANMLWNSWHHRYPPWINYGGSKLFPAPQADWKYPWPPNRDVDQIPGEARVNGQHKLTLNTPYCKEYGISFEREFTLHPVLPLLTLRETIINRSDRERNWGIWEISQLNPGGEMLIPFCTPGDEAEIKGLKEFGSRRHGSMLYVRDCQRKIKGFFHSPLGIIGYLWGGDVLWRFSPPADNGMDYPRGERSLTFFSGVGVFELEAVSPLWQLRPGERRSFTHIWYLGAYQNDAIASLNNPPY